MARSARGADRQTAFLQKGSPRETDTVLPPISQLSDTIQRERTEKMAAELINDGKRLIARLSGEIDHHAAAEMRFAIDGELERSFPELLVLDLGGVDFMDSSGIGLILGRVRVLSGWGGRLAVTGANPAVRKMIKLAGLERLITK